MRREVHLTVESKILFKSIKLVNVFYININIRPFKKII